MAIPAPTHSTIQSLRDIPSLRYKMHVFVFGLHNFKERPSSQARPDLIIDDSYLGALYFDAEEGEVRKAAVISPPSTHHTSLSGNLRTNTSAHTDPGRINQETLDKKLEGRMKKRVESGDFGVCAAHDLAPGVRAGVGISGKEAGRDKEFLKMIEREGWVWLKGKKGGKKGRKGR